MADDYDANFQKVHAILQAPATPHRAAPREITTTYCEETRARVETLEAQVADLITRVTVLEGEAK